MVSTFNFLLTLVTLLFCASKIIAGLTHEQMHLAVDLHDKYRRHVNPYAADMLEMHWDDELADKSQRWADNCEFAYDPKHCSPSFDSIGQNIYASYHPKDILRDAITAWGEEKNYYNYDNNSCTPGRVCGHYTQLIWAKSYRLGMGVSSRKCPSGMYLVVANYAKAGNYLGESPYIRGASGSNCFEGSSKSPRSGMCEVVNEEKLRETIDLHRNQKAPESCFIPSYY